MILSLRLGVSGVVLAKLAKAQPEAAGLLQHPRASGNNTLRDSHPSRYPGAQAHYGI